MYAIGIIQQEKSATGHYNVLLLIEKEWKIYTLANQSEIPQDFPDFGLFKFDKEDQFCFWTNPNKL
jgi:hypothetical protein